MQEETLSMLCNPFTGEPFKLQGDRLVGVASGQSFPIREGIPVVMPPEGQPLRNRWQRRWYDAQAGVYDRLMSWSDSLGSSSEEKLRRQVIARFPVQPGDKVLECAAGTASNLLHLPAHGRYFAQDLSWRMLQQAQRKLQLNERQAELFQCDGAALPFRNNSFDLVFQMGALQFFGDPFRAVSEMARVAKAGSTVRLIDEVSGARRTLRRLPAHARYASSNTSAVRAMVRLVPQSMLEVETEVLPGGDFYLLRFRKPS